MKREKNETKGQGRKSRKPLNKSWCAIILVFSLSACIPEPGGKKGASEKGLKTLEAILGFTDGISYELISRDPRFMVLRSDEKRIYFQLKNSPIFLTLPSAPVKEVKVQHFVIGFDRTHQVRHLLVSFIPEGTGQYQQLSEYLLQELIQAWGPQGQYIQRGTEINYLWSWRRRGEVAKLSIGLDKIGFVWASF
ncbi:MAG: hypothetical protein V2G48_07965 [bacterium JZ-2024 1]